jgi:hypothetical protein
MSGGPSARRALENDLLSFDGLPAAIGQLNGQIGGRRYGASTLVSVHAEYGRLRKPGDVARQHRSRTLRTGGWKVDVPS